MANNRLLLCEVDENNEVVSSLVVAKNMGGEWYCTNYNGDNEYITTIDDFFMKAFLNGNGISLMDEYMNVPLPPLHVYNDPYEGPGHWEFVKD